MQETWFSHFLYSIISDIMLKYRRVQFIYGGVNNRRVKRWIRRLEETVKCCFGSGSEWLGQRFPTVFFGEQLKEMLLDLILKTNFCPQHSQTKEAFWVVLSSCTFTGSWFLIHLFMDLLKKKEWDLSFKEVLWFWCCNAQKQHVTTLFTAWVIVTLSQYTLPNVLWHWFNMKCTTAFSCKNTNKISCVYSLSY